MTCRNELKRGSVTQIKGTKDKIDAGEIFPEVFKSINSDNGLEFAGLTEIESITDSKIYFAHPYTSCERGKNERHNGMIRRCIPKGKR